MMVLLHRALAARWLLAGNVFARPHRTARAATGASVGMDAQQRAQLSLLQPQNCFPCGSGTAVYRIVAHC